MANRRTLSDAEWNHIWKTKFEDPNYYAVRPSCPGTSSILERMARGENAFAAARRRQVYGDYTGEAE